MMRNCRECGQKFEDTRTQCPHCRAMNNVPTAPRGADGKEGDQWDGTCLLSAADTQVVKRFSTGPWDACWGPGGTAAKSVSLVGGAPGGGKSTFTLQMLASMIKQTGREGLLIASEESKVFIKDRALRLGLAWALDKIRVVGLLDGFDGDMAEVMRARKPCLIVNDSLPGMVGGDLAEAVEYCKMLKTFAVQGDVPIVVIDHVNKDNEFAGLRELQHAVDTCITLFPHSPDDPGRMMRTIKNRMGPQTQVCLAMTEKGLIGCPGCPMCTDDDDDDDDEREESDDTPRRMPR